MSSLNRRHNPGRQRRQPLRLIGYDYAQPGCYFVTVVTQDRRCLFGDIAGAEMRLNDAGEMAQKAWEELPQRFPTITLDAFVIMPNHIHGIIVTNTPAEDGATTRVAPTLGDVIGAYKSLTTVAYGRGVNTLRWTPFQGRLWQRNYYEHIVRDDGSLSRIRQYIRDNPAHWAFDRENPRAVQQDR